MSLNRGNDALTRLETGVTATWWCVVPNLHLLRIVEAVEYYEKSAEVAERHLFDTDRAISLYKRILELEPNNLEAHHKIIFLYGQNDDDAGVTSSMEALLSLSSRPARTFVETGRALSGQT